MNTVSQQPEQFDSLHRPRAGPHAARLTSKIHERIERTRPL